MINTQLPRSVKESEGYYEEFVEKFKPKKTTDDCMTPQAVYDVVKEWVFEAYGLSKCTRVVRPFWPGADYTMEDYDANCIVIDNPPFSIISQIVRWYEEKKIRYFLFAPHLTLFSVNSGQSNYVISCSEVIYENGANVKTSFVTNLGDDRVWLCNELSRRIREAVKSLKPDANLPVYDYPMEVITAARLGKLMSAGIDFKVPKTAVKFIWKLDAQKNNGIFGGGFLISEKAALEKAALEKAALEKAALEKAALEKAALTKKTVYPLSDKEKWIVKLLYSKDDARRRPKIGECAEKAANGG